MTDVDDQTPQQNQHKSNVTRQRTRDPRQRQRQA